MFFDKELAVRIFIYCADPREEANLGEKIEEFLKPDEKIMRISTLGGPICLAHPEDLRDEANSLLKQLRFALRVFPGTTEIVLISHNCGYYANVSRFCDESDKIDDLAKAAEFLRTTFRNINISAYYNKGGEDESCFEEIGNCKALTS